jgi:PAS domain S-box-containing protein
MKIDTRQSEPIEALARYRYTIIRHAKALVGDVAVQDQASGEARSVLALLAASLEELKVAEQELRIQNATLTAQREQIDERTRHYRELFLQSPAPALVTDIFGTIFEANHAAGRLFRRAPDHLARKPIAAMVPTESRELFRRQFSHFTPSESPRQWHFKVNRVGDVPLDVYATMQFVAGLGPTSSGVLLWMFAPREPSWTDRVGDGGTEL